MKSSTRLEIEIESERDMEVWSHFLPWEKEIYGHTKIITKIMHVVSVSLA